MCVAQHCMCFNSFNMTKDYCDIRHCPSTMFENRTDSFSKRKRNEPFGRLRAVPTRQCQKLSSNTTHFVVASQATLALPKVFCRLYALSIQLCRPPKVILPRQRKKNASGIRSQSPGPLCDIVFGSAATLEGRFLVEHADDDP